MSGRRLATRQIRSICMTLEWPWGRNYKNVRDIDLGLKDDYVIIRIVKTVGVCVTDMYYIIYFKLNDL